MELSAAQRAARDAALNHAAAMAAWRAAPVERRDRMPLLTELVALTLADVRAAVPGWRWPDTP